MASCRGFNQLTGNSHPTNHFPHTAFQYIADAQFATNLPDIDGLALVSERRVSSDDEQRLESRQSRKNILDKAVSEIFLIRIAAHDLKGQNGNGRLVGKRK